ncbi:WD-40 repeat-containing protein [Calothrix sp. NIES-4071]|nr:WD-40 repeat-containing protein [Calothrix sp. NIES-4071]BAZ58724.1 WD-40 repeat-containing protein [Calothrix sp. NIES-4105]
MLLHSSSRCEEFAQKFVQANESWNLEQLYQDIAFAKHQERQLYRKQLTPTEKACLRGLICGYSPTEIAWELNREPNGLRVELSRGLYRYIESLTHTRIKNWSNVSKELENKGYKLHSIGTNVAANCRDVTCNVSTIQNPFMSEGKSIHCRRQIQNQTDWGEAIDVSIFYGRHTELTTLQYWIEQDKCRVVALLGMGGIGKTALSVKLAQLVENEFDFVIWRSLRDAPTIEELLDTLIKFFSCQQEINLPQTVGTKISRLIEYLRNARCLIVLDNFDAVLSGGERAGNYRSGYEDYGVLLQRLSETAHNSCLVLTSREKPTEVAAYSGEFLPVRTLQLSGLNNDHAQGILAAKGLTGSVEEIEKLIECYGGNPLALKIAATSIFDLFDGSIADFLQEGTTVFNGVRNLLDRQFKRLSPLEEDVMYWTCINREPVQVAELQGDIVPTVSKGNVLESLESLTWRSLIEKRRDVINHVSTFTQQPVIMEYMTERLVTGATQEIKTGKINLLNKYALIKATAKDYIRSSQVRVILEPVLANLQSDLKSQSVIEQKIKNNLYNLRDQFSNQSGYLNGNLINLLHHLNVDLTGYDFSGLTIWQAYLQGANLHHCNFINANIHKSNY